MRCDNLFGFRAQGGPLARTRTLHGRSQHDSSGESAGESADCDEEVSREADEIRTPPVEVHRPRKLCEVMCRLQYNFLRPLPSSSSSSPAWKVITKLTHRAMQTTSEALMSSLLSGRRSTRIRSTRRGRPLMRRRSAVALHSSRCEL